jgi:ATP-dependent Lhr-like helicase
MVDAVRRGELDRTPKPRHPLDVLAQQVVASCVPEIWDETALYDVLRRSWPYRDLARADFDSILALHADGRRALLHRDGVQGACARPAGAAHRADRAAARSRTTASTVSWSSPRPRSSGSLDEDFAGRVQRGRRVPARQCLVARAQGRARRHARRRCPGPTADDPVLAGRGTRAQPRAVGGGVALSARNAIDPAWTEQAIAASPTLAEPLAGFLNEGMRTLGAIPTTDTS